MNILFINNFDVSPNTGGVNRITYTLSRKFKEAYKAGCFLGFFEDNVPPADFDAKIKLSKPFNHAQFEEFLLKYKIDVVQINFLKKYNTGAIPHIYGVAHKNNIRVISCFHMSPGFELFTYSNLAKTVFAIRHRKDVGAELRKLLICWIAPFIKHISHLLLRPKYRTQYLNCDKVVVLSPGYVKPYAKQAGAKSTDKICAIGNALTFDEFITNEEIRLKQKEVLIVARLEEHTKRLSLALKIWKQIEKNEALKDWQLTIVGDGKDYEFYQNVTKKLKLKRCRFEGRQYPLSYYKRASVFMMTSAAEGWPMTLMEAEQMGVVTVAFNSYYSLTDIISDKVNGVIVPNNNIRAFTQALTDLMLNNEQRMAMAEKAVESSKRFTQESVAKQWINLYNSHGE